MAEENGKHADRMNRKEFFQLCEELRNRREVLMKDRPSAREACESLAKSLGFPMSPSALREAKEVTGVEWSVPNPGPRSREFQQRNTVTLALSLILLYRRLGERCPQELLDVYTRQSHRTIPDDLVLLEKLF